MSSTPIASIFNDGYVAEAYERFRRDPSSLDESWRQFFRFAESLGGTTGGASDGQALRKAAGAAALAAAIRARGHLAVALDPLGTAPAGSPELTPEYHGVTDADLQAIPASAIGDEQGGTALDAIERLRERYCGAIAYEFEHLSDTSEREWLRSAVAEGTYTAPLTPDEKKRILERLTEVDGLERFLGLAFVNAKRFSIEGLDAMVPMIDEAIVRGAHGGARHVVLGMAHRGRLNVLVNVMGKPAGTLFGEFEGHHDDTNAASGTGDVKYHLGHRTTTTVEGVGEIAVRLEANPSHLEVVNPVATGVARALGRVQGGAPDERNAKQVLPLLIHGDAAFPGEGVVSETLNLMNLRGFSVGGTLHVIANNQVGFTTDPSDSRSTRYSSDLAKGFDVPIVHVNADDAESCVQAIRMAVAFRERFGKDFVIDLIGFRRHGHNEADQPSFTQPKLYELIKTHPSPRETWGARLVRERIVSEADVQSLDKQVQARYQQAFDEMKKKYADVEHHAPGSEPAPAPQQVETSVKSETLVSLNEQLLAFPSGFKLHPTLMRTLPRRRDAINNKGIDWGHAEALAFASLLTEGVSVRLTGQDAERGTFSHRQAVLHDVATGEEYTPLAHLPQAKAGFEVYNSPLSETAVMGFEYGYSVASPDTLTLWEAQFGDFANVAQPMVDQFLAADRAKWGQDSGLVLLLPHGYEGQGPEHSSARLERYLQLCAENNMVVAYPSTPAQYFHVLRRQARRQPRRPLVLMQPKSLLRLPAAASALEDLTSGSFRAVIDDPTVGEHRDNIRRLVFCTGKIYYDLIAAERAEGVAIVRVEELYPWPAEVAELVDRYPNVDEVVWAQEEPRNMGAWTYVQPRLRASVGTVTTLRYIGRPERASPAEGYNADHLAEQARIVRDALTPSAVSGKRKAVKA